MESSSPSVELNIVHGDHEYQIPVKSVKTQQDMMQWESSIAYQEYMGFILAINEAVKSHKNAHKTIQPSEMVIKVVELLNSLDTMIEENPPKNQPQRFGNLAFRSWIVEVTDQCFDLLKKLLPIEFHRAMPEIKSYFTESFGNSTRIDYGTGHEASFLMFLCCLYKIGALKEEDKIFTGTIIFKRYLELVRKLQQTYRMEPAGSHGVWSLDDYQFVPFIWGSSQLIGHTKLSPTCFLDTEIVETFSNDFLFLSAIEYIMNVKTGPFAEHSNQLWGISGVPSWSKINSGLIKMYKAEVLGKFPVVQHMLFGSLLPLLPYTTIRDPLKPYLGMTPPVRTPHSHHKLNM